MKQHENKYEITLTVNNIPYTVETQAHQTLLQLLKETLHLTGTKEGCGVGECGACTVIMNGKTVTSCLVLAVEADGATIRTIEGEARDGQLSDLQQAFIDFGGTQCGFCTPGMIMSAQNLLDHNSNPTRDEIREAIAGNLCRCTGYDPIVDAVEHVAKKLTGKERS